MDVGTLEEVIDDTHAIVSTSVGSLHYVAILTIVDKNQLEIGCSVLLHHKVSITKYVILLALYFLYFLFRSMQ